MIGNLNKAIFVDKDGTLIPDIPYNVDPDLITLMEGAAEGLALLQREGFKVIVVTNQSGVARGLFKEEDLKRVEKKLKALLADKGVMLDGFYYCPHHPNGIIKEFSFDCDCRKPHPGLILTAAKHLHIDLSTSWMIGDILKDIEAGNKAGCNTILVGENSANSLPVKSIKPNYFSKNLYEAALSILHHQ